MDYKAAYDLVLQIQQQLEAEVLAEAEQELQQKDYLRHLDYLKIKALAATYELQEYLAGYCHEDE